MKIMKIIAIIFVIIFVIVLAVLVLLDEFGVSNTKERERDRFLIWVIVPPGYGYVRLRFGVPYKKSVLKEGYHILIPGIY